MKVFTDSLHRIAYSTDASAYREVPKGVAFPACEQHILELVHIAKSQQTHLIPRAGGTSIAGQVVGSGIVVDISKYLNRILEINPEQRWALVQPGVILDELNLACKPYGLFFSPETSTGNRCCIGGMFGNNSCGSHSLIYGSTRHHVLEAKGILADGTVEHFKAYSLEELECRFGKGFWINDESNGSLIQRIYSQLIRYATDADTVRLIEKNYPDRSLRRRSCGYAIDEVIEELVDGSKPLKKRSINLCKLLSGSEGTLAFMTEIKVSLDPLPPKECMLVCAHCDTLEKSFLANLVALQHTPAAIELIDRHILELSKDNVEQQKNRFFVEGDPAAILVIELKGNTREEIDQMASRLEKELFRDDRRLVYCCTRVYGSDTSNVWSLRKAGLGLLNGMKGDAKPVGVIEDTAVAPDRLPDYMADIAGMLKQLGLSCVYHAHISTGELHLRPVINLKTAEGRELFRKVAYETALLVKKHHGSLSGEHGDGRLRGEFIRLLYGEETYRLMQDVKKCWDPDGIFNVHKIVNTLPMDCGLRFEVDQRYAIETALSSNETYFNWKAAFDTCKINSATDTYSQMHAWMCSVEQCNGAGDCRKSNVMGGTLCPAYKVSSDETRTTRGRANILREVLTRGWDSEAFSNVKSRKGSLFTIPDISEVLDSCLACKGCRSECPSNVDMTRLRAEVLQHCYDVAGIPFRSFMIARMAMVARTGSVIAPVYNFFATWNGSASLIKKVVKFSSERNIPVLSRKTMRQLVKIENRKLGNLHPKKKIYLFADEFTNYQEAELGLTFARLLIALGYSVEIPRHVESGRAALSKGSLKLVQKFAVKNVSLLKDLISDERPLVGIEPSCVLSFRDEYPDLVPAEMREDALQLGENCLLYDEFILREVEAGTISPSDFKEDMIEIWLHGHCHQKALVGIEKTVAMLQLLRRAKVNVIPSGCCGMAGSFGYEKEHYQTSLAIGEMVLFPAIRQAVDGDNSGTVPVVVAAPGTSCRQQIKDGTGVKAVHPIEILYQWINFKKKG